MLVIAVIVLGVVAIGVVAILYYADRPAYALYVLPVAGSAGYFVFSSARSLIHRRSPGDIR